ncbi:MAG: capsule assembly Wzi family protein [Roseburia sp.]|nr:capsule assembly Wzi family protein [Roseburia sp.]
MLSLFRISAETPAIWSVGAEGWYGSGMFAPHLMSTNCFGTRDMKSGGAVSAAGILPVNMSRKLSFGGGVEVYGAWQESVAYQRYDDGTMTEINRHPARVWLQQAYAEMKYRAISVEFGLRNHGSTLLDDRLSSGDLVHSSNARPIPQLRFGLNHFVDIPLTKRWLQICAEMVYGRFTDDNWWRDHFNYYTGHIASGEWYTYRRVHFRTNPDKRVAVTFGVQSAAEFGGTTEIYDYGKLERIDRRGLKLKDFFKIQWPTGGETFVFGNTLGAWDVKASIRVGSGARIDAYVQMPWEDGSGMAKRNGFDGLYGIAWNSDASVICGAAIEWLDLTNQSGPMHWAPNDYPGTTIVGEATGADNYYNNGTYNAYASYGRTIGSSMVMGPLYNLNGVINIAANRVRGLHAAVIGKVQSLKWRVAFEWRKAYGNGFIAIVPAIHSVSALAEASWSPRGLQSLELTAAGAFDRGTMPGNSAAIILGTRYSGDFSL